MIKFSKAKRLAVLKRAREIISDPNRWTQGALRRRVAPGSRKYQYCLLGACEEAVYQLNLVPRPRRGFDFGAKAENGYEIGRDLSLHDFSTKTRGYSPSSINDHYGHASALRLLDDYIAKVKTTPAKEIS